jgi:putative aldouronate transport system substrate-binding protein
VSTELPRRTFLRLAGGATLAGGALLTACAAPATPATPKPTVVAATSAARASVYPTYMPSASGPKPDLHDPDPRYEDGYNAYPKNPAKSWTKAPPSNGGTISFLVNQYSTPPAPPRDNNPAWQAIEKELNATLRIDSASAADYPARVATTMAGNDLPDIMHLNRGYRTAGNLPDFFKAKCADLTPYLGGDAVKDYPNLAAIPTYAWKNSISAVDGKLYLIPLQRQIPAGVANAIGYFFKNTDIWNKTLGENANPKNAAELKSMLQQLNKPSANQWAVENVATYWYGLPAYMAMFGAPYNWRLDGAGTLTKDFETDEGKAAVAYLADLWASGLFPPDALQSNTISRNDFVAGKMAVEVDGFGNSWNDFWRRGLQAKPPQHFDFIPPFTHDGAGKPQAFMSGGFLAMNVLKQAPPDRIKEVLRVIDWLAAPFGTEEDRLLSYGVADIDYKLDDNANPIPTAQGNLDAVSGLWKYITQRPQVAYLADIPGYAQAVWDAEHTLIPIGVEDPVATYYSQTAFSKGVSATLAVTDGMNQIIVGHDPMSNYDQLVKDWRAAAGDQMRKEYLDAIAAAK